MPTPPATTASQLLIIASNAIGRWSSANGMKTRSSSSSRQRIRPPSPRRHGPRLRGRPGSSYADLASAVGLRVVRRRLRGDLVAAAGLPLLDHVVPGRQRCLAGDGSAVAAPGYLAILAMSTTCVAGGGATVTGVS